MCCDGVKQEQGGPACSKADCRMRCAHSIITFGVFQLILGAALIGYNYVTLWQNTYLGFSVSDFYCMNNFYNNGFYF